MKLRIGAVIAALLMGAATVYAQSPQVSAPLAGTTCPGTGCVTLNVQGLGSVAVQLTGTFSATVQFEASIDGRTYTSLNVTPITGAETPVTSATAPGIWGSSVAGLAIVRVRVSSYSSGTVNAVLMAASAGSSLSASSGSGSGVPGGANTSVQFNNAGNFGGFGTWDGTTFAVGNGTAVTGSTSLFNSAAGVGPLAVLNQDPIFGTPAKITQVIGDTFTDSTLASYGAYVGVSAEPSASASAIFVGSEIVVNEPDTNTHSMSQFYGQEAFVYHNSAQASVAAFGFNAAVLWSAGNVSGRLVGQNIQVENDGDSNTVHGVRGVAVSAGNYGLGTVDELEGINILSPGTGGTTTAAWGLRIADQTVAGASTNYAIDVNSKFLVGPDGGTLRVVGTVQSAFKSLDGTAGATVTTCTGFKNGLCISGT